MNLFCEGKKSMPNTVNSHDMSIVFICSSVELAYLYKYLTGMYCSWCFLSPVSQPAVRGFPTSIQSWMLLTKLLQFLMREKGRSRSVFRRPLKLVCKEVRWA
jgi:hypothetical protein